MLRLAFWLSLLILSIFALSNPVKPMPRWNAARELVEMTRGVFGAGSDNPPRVAEKVTRAFCAADARSFDMPFAGVYWNGWGVDLNNRRSQPGPMAGLQRDEVPRLKLKWAFGVPDVSEMPAQPAVAGGRLFFGSSVGKVYSLDAQSACIYWVFDAGAKVRTAITIGPAGRRWAAYFGDNGTNGTHAYAVDASTGRLIWKTTVGDAPYARITGAPALAAGKLYVPVTANEDAAAEDPGFQCCRFRGSVVALDAVTGAQIWKSYTIPESPQPRRRNSRNVRQWGPSGAGIWSAPTLDVVKRRVYVATGDSHSDPAANTSDAVRAFDMDTGMMLWSRQMTPGDAWNAACVWGDPANCPDAHGADLDFGSSPILVDLQGGRRALIAGQKSGVVYALDPDQQGELLWQTRIGEGGPAGGILWGPAADGRSVYVALSGIRDAFPAPALSSGQPLQAQAFYEFGRLWDRVRRRLIYDDGGGMFALSLTSGERIWYSPPQCDGLGRCRPAQPAAVTHIPGVVFSGAIDGYLRAYSTDDGRVIWAADTAQAFSAVNGGQAQGGTIDGPGPVVAGGVLYVNSGYTVVRGAAGNALLAYSVDGK
jgi:polyvinyl alcohol dehydrogenase (cytochrome)